MRGLPPETATEGGPLPELLAAGRPPGSGNREKGTGPRPRRLRRGQAPPAVVRRRGEAEPPPPAPPARRGTRPRRAARSPLGATGAVGPGPVPVVSFPALDRRVGQQPRPRTGPGHRLPARRGPRLEPPRPGTDPPGPGRHARQPRPRREDPLVIPGTGTAAPRPERLPHRRDPRPGRAARRRPRPSPGHLDQGQARHAGAGHRRLRPQLGTTPCSTAHPGPCPAARTPPASTSAARTPSWNSGPHATTTCARSPPATPTRRSPRCAGTSGARPSPRCGP